jgi:hypothetical protein
MLNGITDRDLLMQWQRSFAGFPNIRVVQDKESDHSFSSHRSWLVRTVTD